MKLKNNLKVASIILATLFFTSVFSQEAEKIYHEKYSKLSLVIQPSKLYGYTVFDTNSPSVEFNETFSAQFGIVYNFAQYKNFNFKTGVIAKMFYPTYDLIVSNDDIDAGYDYTNILTDVNATQQFVISEILKVEYIKPISNKINFVTNIGISLDLRTGGILEKSIKINVNDYNTGNLKTIFIGENKNPQLTGSLDLSIGANFKSKLGLFQLEVFRNSQLLNYAETGTFKFVNLKNTPDKTFDYIVKGNYKGLSLTFSPKKKWLIRKSKR